MLFIHSSGLLAQLVEQLTFNQLVPRSSRGQPTIFSLIFINRSALSGSRPIKISLKDIVKMFSF